MRHYHTIQDVHLNKPWLTIGAYDGVHRGHQQIIKQLVSEAHAAGSETAVLTFHPHPEVILRGTQELYYLTTPYERAELLGELGIDTVITHPFNRQVANLSALDFITILKEHLDPAQIWVGYDFAMGKNREADIPMLEQLGKRFGFKLRIVPAFKVDGTVVSSSFVRQLIRDGKVKDASIFLGRPYVISGRIVQGASRGRNLGFPTANLDVRNDRAVPGAGVYACWVNLNEETFPAVANVGIRPTFEMLPVAPTIEAHILDFNQDIYNRQVKVGFVERLRDEQRFETVDALVNQIMSDIGQARRILAG